MNADVDKLQQILTLAKLASRDGPPRRTSNPFFGVGPITDAVSDEVQARRQRIDFEHWFEETYRKRDDKGRDIGPYTVAEVARSMHRGMPADAIILDMMRSIHRYFGFPRSNRLAVGLGGGHAGFTVAALHFISATEQDQHIFIDTPMPESDESNGGGFFRQSWGTQLLELMLFSKSGDEDRLHFADKEGNIPTPAQLSARGVKLVFGVGHETTGATTYSKSDIQNLLAWLDFDSANHHAILDATSLLGAMPWGPELSQKLITKCCFFMPLQKAIGGVSGYYVMSLTPQALTLIERNSALPIAPIPRQLKLAAPVNQKRPLSGRRSVHLGPLYDPHDDKMLGGVINTFSNLAFAETTFGLQDMAKRCGPVAALNHRSVANRAAIDAWLENQNLFEHAVSDPERRGAAVTLLKANDSDIRDKPIHDRIVARTKHLLGVEGLTHPDGFHEAGLDVARYINAFPGTPGDFRAWIGGIRDQADVTALLENLSYGWHRAKAVVMQEELMAAGLAPQFRKSPDAKLQSFSVARNAAEDVAAILAGLDSISQPTLQKSAIARHRKALLKAADSLAKALKATKPAPAVRRSRSESPSGTPKIRRPRSGTRP